MNTNSTIPIGIPAHNEEANIARLIHTVMRQKGSNFTLSTVRVLCDGCTDDTEKIVRDLQKTYPLLEVINDGLRLGKVGRLNQLYQENTSDLLFTLDGDVLPERDTELSLLIENFADEKVQVVSAHQVPVKPSGFSATVVYTIFELWNEVRKHLPDPNHIANMYGSATMLRKEFAKTVSYPVDITADCDFLYLMAKRANGFAYEPRTRILYRTAATISEMRLQGTRFLTERHALTNQFGNEVTAIHHIPMKVKVLGLIAMFRKSPVYTALALLVMFSFRVFPHTDLLMEHGMWEVATSTKDSISAF